MVQRWEAFDIAIDGRTFWARPVGAWVLDSGKRRDPTLGGIARQAFGMGRQVFFSNVELSLELWTVIAGISGFDD